MATIAPGRSGRRDTSGAGSPEPCVIGKEGQQPGIGDAPRGQHEEPIHCCVYWCYYMLLFLSFWFGSARFDVDGDGDFDPADVQAFLRNRRVVDGNRQITQRSQSTLGQKAAAKKGPAPTSARNPSGGWLDRDGDGHVGLSDLAAKVEGHAVEDEMVKNLSQMPPAFMVAEMCLCVLLWLGFALADTQDKGSPSFVTRKAGLDSLWEQKTDLRLTYRDCEDLRPEVWRWLTYQWTHVGAGHVAMNTILCFILGIPIEGIHGFWRTCLMFNVGVVGGALCFVLADAHGSVVGCSGGCYALIGIHLANLVMNWAQKKFRYPTLAMIFLLIFFDVANSFLRESEGKSHSAHVGGFVAGLCAGVLVGRNYVVKLHEKVISFCVLIIAAVLVAGCVLYVVAFCSDGPRSVFEVLQDKPGWCWVRQVFNASIDSTRWICVRCGTRECMDTWGQQQHIHAASYKSCAPQGFHHDGR